MKPPEPQRVSRDKHQSVPRLLTGSPGCARATDIRHIGWPYDKTNEDRATRTPADARPGIPERPSRPRIPRCCKTKSCLLWNSMHHGPETDAIWKSRRLRDSSSRPGPCAGCFQQSAGLSPTKPGTSRAHGTKSMRGLLCHHRRMPMPGSETTRQAEVMVKAKLAPSTDRSTGRQRGRVTELPTPSLPHRCAGPSRPLPSCDHG